MRKTFNIIVGAVMIITACQSNTKKASDDINAIRNIQDQSVAAVRAKDINQILNSYSSDAIEMPPNEPITVGIEAIKKGWELWFSDTTLMHEKFIETVDNIEVSSSGDLGYIRTTSHIFIKTTNGNNEQEEKNIYIYKKKNGEWKLIVAIWNDNEPLENK